MIDLAVSGSDNLAALSDSARCWRMMFPVFLLADGDKKEKTCASIYMILPILKKINIQILQWLCKFMNTIYEHSVVENDTHSIMQDQVSELKEVQAAFEICVIFKDLQLTAFMFALSV